MTVLRSVVNVFYFVEDLAAAAVWYGGRLGLAAGTVQPQLVMFDLGDARLTLHAQDEYNRPAPEASGPVAYWDVEDVDATVAAWVAAGAVAHRGPKTIFTGERLCQLADPFGNLVGLRQAAR